MSDGITRIVSCEHGGKQVPRDYQHLFTGCEELLASHRGWDIGILSLARDLARELSVSLHASTVSRLLVDLNRSLGSRSLFSECGKDLTSEQRQKVLQRYYHPYRQAVEGDVACAVSQGGKVLHLSVHSFTPVLKGQVRTADIGLLYDPSREVEKHFCLDLAASLQQRIPSLRVRRNYPYRGTADSLVTALRKRFPASSYGGIELEVNQRYFAEAREAWVDVRSAIIQATRTVLEGRKFSVEDWESLPLVPR